MMRENLMKAAMERGEVPVGIGLQESLDATMVNAVARAGADFIFIDSEHFPLSGARMARAILTAHAAQITPLIRVPGADRALITQLLDSGAQTLIVPRVTSPAEVEKFVSYTRYKPQGQRGIFMGGSAGTNYDFVAQADIPAVIDQANNSLLLGVNVETAEAMECLDDLLVPGINFATLGHSDLSASYGVPGQFEHPLVIAAHERLLSLCKQRGLFYGAAPARLTDISAAVASGANFITYGGVVSFVRAAVRAAIECRQQILK